MVPSAVGVQESFGGNNRPAPSSYKPEAQASGTLLPRLRFGLVKDGSADTGGRFAPHFSPLPRFGGEGLGVGGKVGQCPAADGSRPTSASACRRKSSDNRSINSSTPRQVRRHCSSV